MAFQFGDHDINKKFTKLNFGEHAPLPEDMEYQQFRKKWLKNDARSMGDAVWAFGESVPDGLYEYFTEDVAKALSNKSMVRSMLGLGKRDGDAKKAWESLYTAGKVGMNDSINAYEMAEAFIRDEFIEDLDQETRIKRAFGRHKHEVNYFNGAREKMMESVAPEFRDDMSVLADFLDPTNLMPSAIGTKFLDKASRKALKKSVEYAGKGIEAGASVAQRISKGAGFPARGLEKLMPERGGALYRGLQGASAVGMFTPMATVSSFVAGATVVEFTTALASKVGRQAGQVAKIFAQPSSHSRFLHRLSTSDAVSPKIRKLATRLYKIRGTNAYDVLFNSMIAGMSAGSFQIGMEALKGKSAEEIGYATGAGIAMGAPTGLMGDAGSGKSIKEYDEQGNPTDRTLQGIEDYVSKKSQIFDMDTMKAFNFLDTDSKLAISTLDALGDLGNLRMQMFTSDELKTYLDKKNEQAGKGKIGVVPPAVYETPTKTILLNEDKLNEAGKLIPKVFLHEYGHHFLNEMLGSSPLMAREILENFQDPNGTRFFFKDQDGKQIGSIRLNDEAVAFANKYSKDIDQTDNTQSEALEERDAYLLAQEIGAEQFSMMMQDKPNVFADHNKKFIHLLLGSLRNSLARIGVLNPKTGNDAQSMISKAMLKNEGVRNAYNNYIKERTKHYRQRADDIETGRKHSPKPNQTSSERFQQLFGGFGVNLQTASQFYVKDSVMAGELEQADELVNASADSDYVGIGKGREGKRLHHAMREIFGKAGKYNNTVRNIIDMIQVAIDERKMLKFGYRSASRKNWSDYNAFFERSVTPYGWQITPKKARNWHGKTIYPNLKIVGYDADVVQSNIEILTQAGFITDPENFMRTFAQHAQSVLTEKGEARINPEGRGENEMMVAVLGMKGSMTNIREPRLAEFLSNKENKIKDSFRSYDVGQLAGLATQNKDGYAFDYRNARDNYMPSLAGQGSENSTIKPKILPPKKITVKNRSEELQALAELFNEGKISAEQYAKGVQKYSPVSPLTVKDIKPETRERLIYGLRLTGQRERIGAGKKIKKGTRVGIRLDITAYDKYNVWSPTIHDSNGRPIAHEPTAVIDNADFTQMFDDRSQQKSLRIAMGGEKNPFATINGDWNPMSEAKTVALAKQALANKDGAWTQVGFDPQRHSYFYDRKNHRVPLAKAEQVVQVGRAVFAKNAQFKSKRNGEFFYAPQQDFGLLGNVENGDLLYSKSGLLHMMDHSEPHNAPPRGNPWRYNAEEETVYWWEGMPNQLDKDTVTAHLERKGYKVKRNKHLDGKSKEFAKDYESAHAFPLKFSPAIEDMRAGKLTAKIKPYPMYPPTEGNMKMEAFLKSKDIFEKDGTISIYKIVNLGLQDVLETAVEKELLSLSKPLIPINYDTELRRNYKSNDPRRGTGDYLKDGYEYDRSSLPVGGKKGTVEGGDRESISFVHFPTNDTRHRILKTSAHGTGIAGAEAKRRKVYPEIYVNRIYFGDEKYNPEKGLNVAIPHRLNIAKDNLFTGTPHYDPQDFLVDFENYFSQFKIESAGNGRVGNTVGDARQTAFESFLKELGYLGIHSEKDNVGFMFHDVEVGDADNPTTIDYEPPFTPSGRDYFSPDIDPESLAPTKRQLSKQARESKKQASFGVAPLREQLLPDVPYARRMAKQAFYKKFLTDNKKIVKALGLALENTIATIGAWKDSVSNALSRENSQRLVVKYARKDDIETAMALMGALAPEVQDSVLSVQYSNNAKGREFVLDVDPQYAENIISLETQERYNLVGENSPVGGFTYDPETSKLIYAVTDTAGADTIADFISDFQERGINGVTQRKATVRFPEAKNYRRLLSESRINRLYKGDDWKALRELASEARDRLGFNPKKSAKKILRGKVKPVKSKTQFKKEGKVISEHDTLIAPSNVIAKDKNYVTKSLETMNQRGWNQILEANTLADALQADMDDGGTGEQNWIKINSLRTQKSIPTEIAIPPSTLHRWITVDGAFQKFFLDKVREDPEYLESALQGLASVMPNHEMARQGKIPTIMTALHAMWGVMSISAPPVAQESGWIKLVNDPKTLEYLYDSIDGNFNLSEADWENHVSKFLKSVKDGGDMADIYNYIKPSGKKRPFAGNSVTMNANSIHKVLESFNGRWDQLNDIINNPDLTGSQMRDEFFKQGFGGNYLGNKILSFVLATIARDDLVIIDRWQLINLWKDYLDKRSDGQPFRYEKDGTPVETSNFYDTYVNLLSGTEGLAVFKTIEVAMNKLIEKNEVFLNEQLASHNIKPSIFALHWITWNMIKKEAVGHSSLDVTQKYLLEGNYPNELSQRRKFIKDFTAETKSTEEVLRTKGGGRKKLRHTVEKGKNPYITELRGS